MSEEQKNKAKFAVWCWQYSNTGSISQQVCSLWMKADFENRRRLELGFPEICAAMSEWYQSENPDELLDKWMGFKGEP